MPSSETPLPADDPPASDEVLRLLHTSLDRWSPGITATLHQWHDVAAMLVQIPAGARRAAFGGLGFLIDTAGDFQPDIPAGMHITEEPDDDPPGPVNPASIIARQAAKEARSAVKSFLGVIGVIGGEETR